MVEILLALAVVGVLVGLGGRPGRAWADRLAVSRAVQDVAAAYRRVRFAGMLAARPARLEVTGDSLRGYLELARGDTTILSRGRAGPGVQVVPVPRVFRFYATGIAAGAGNVTLTFRRGGATDTLVTSRAGRIRRRADRLQPSTP